MDSKIEPIRYIPCLDKGYIELVDHLGTDLTIVNAARVSFNNTSQELTQKDEKLIDYLVRHKHISTMYHNYISFRVKAPISVQRQAFKHKVGTAENSESTRYVEIHEEFYIPTWFRTQSKSNKQGSAEAFVPRANQRITNRHIKQYRAAYKAYQADIKDGVARELARDLLPLATYTSWYWTLSLVAALHFIDLRTKSGAQYEIRVYAQAMESLLRQYYPVAMQAFCKHYGESKLDG